MNLTPREKDKLMISLAAMVARGRLARGVKLNHPEAIALITDFVMEGARDGRSVADLIRPGVAGLGDAVAVATLALFAPDAEDRLGALRAVLPSDGVVRAAASAWDGRVVARFMAPAAWPLRQAVARAVATVTGGVLPRVWQI